MGVMEVAKKGRGSSCGLVGDASEWWEWGVVPPSLAFAQICVFVFRALLRTMKFYLHAWVHTVEHQLALPVGEVQCQQQCKRGSYRCSG